MTVRSSSLRSVSDRRSYSSKNVLTLKLASILNSENELKNVILAAF